MENLNTTMAAQSAELRTQVNTTPPAIPPVAEVKKRSATDRIREKLLAAKPREDWVEVEDPESGEKEVYLLISPSVRQSNTIIRSAMELPKGKDIDEVKVSDVSIDNAEIQVQALIACLRDNDTKMPVLSQADREALLDGPLSYLFGALGTRAAAMVNPNPKRAKKNSNETASG